MFSNKIDDFLFKRLGHKAQHLYEMGPKKGSHPMVVLGYFKVGGPEKKQKKRRKREGRKEERSDKKLKTTKPQFLWCTTDLHNIHPIYV
jgi:hypothetical protein